MQQAQTDMRRKAFDRHPLVEVRAYKRFHPCAISCSKVALPLAVRRRPVWIMARCVSHEDRRRPVARWSGAPFSPSRNAEEGIEDAAARAGVRRAHAARVACFPVDEGELDFQDREVMGKPGYGRRVTGEASI
jgi:hypothetical protein